MKTTFHLPRRAVEAITEPMNAALISISDSRGEHAKVNDSAWLAVLRIRFDDLSNQVWQDMGEGYVAPKAEHAMAIARFIRDNKGRSIVAHCEAGISRSAAVCTLLRDLGWQYRDRMECGLQHANPLLLRLLRAEFREHEFVGRREEPVRQEPARESTDAEDLLILSSLALPLAQETAQPEAAPLGGGGEFSGGGASASWGAPDSGSSDSGSGGGASE